jgi:hypothetical protein
MSKFIVSSISNPEVLDSEAAAIDKASKLLSKGGNLNGIGVYRLVKIIRPKVVPVEIEEVSCCEDVRS